jgi:hypothetical protein
MDSYRHALHCPKPATLRVAPARRGDVRTGIRASRGRLDMLRTVGVEDVGHVAEVCMKPAAVAGEPDL